MKALEHIPLNLALWVTVCTFVVLAGYYLLRAFTFSLWRDLIGMCVCLWAVGVLPWDALLHLHFAPLWLNSMAVFGLWADWTILRKEIVPYFRQQKLRV